MVMRSTVGLNIGLLAAQKSTRSLGKINRHRITDFYFSFFY